MEVITMMEIIILVLMMFVLFSIVGKVLGLVFGIIGYVLIGVLSVAAFGMAIIFLPIIVILGIVGIGALAGSVA